MPNKPKTPNRSVRIPSPEWEAAQTKARAEGVTVSHVVRQALRNYTKGEK